MLETLWQDIRYAVRSVARRPLMSGVAVLSLALGIGVNTAIFSAFERLVLRRLAVPAAHELVNVTVSGPRPGFRSSGDAGGLESVVSYPLFRDLERVVGTGLSAVAAHRNFGASVSFAGHTSTTDGLFVSGSYFPTLRATPALGRLLGPADDRTEGGHPVVVLSHAYWTTRFGADPSMVGRSILVNREPMTVVGIAPAGFWGTTTSQAPAIFLPLAMARTAAPRDNWNGFQNRSDHWLYVFARLAPGTTREQAEARTAVPFTALTRDVEFPSMRSGMGTRDREQFLARRLSLEDGSRGWNPQRERAPLIFVLMLMVTGLVLAVAAANVANLLLARGADRAAEIAVRLALGASAGRLVRLLLIEAVTLGALGACGALGVGWAGVTGLLVFLPASEGPALAFEFNAPVLAFSMILGVGTGLLVGLFPALHSVRTSVAAGLQAQPGRASGSRTSRRVRTALATAQIALATTLLAQAGLFLVSLANISRADTGLRRENVVMFTVFPGQNGYTPARAAALFAQIEDALRGLPGVLSVSAANIPVLGFNGRTNNLTVQGARVAEGTDSNASYTEVGTGYFDTLGVPFISGRDFTEADGLGAPKAAIVNEAFARKFGLGANVIGTRMARGEGGDRPLDIEIVGLVRDTKYDDLRATPPPQFFLPYRQSPVGPLTLYAHVTPASTRAVLSAIPVLIARADAQLPITQLRTMDDQLQQNMGRERALTTLSGSFAALATLLAAIGLYAVLAYGVAQRLREMGIRMALGATSGQVRRLVFRHVSGMAIVGGTLGCAVAVGLGRLSRALLFGVEGMDLRVLAGTTTLVLAVAFLAGAVPARRAAAVNPAEALRAE